MSEHHSDRLLDVAATCQRLQISKPTLYKLVRSGGFAPLVKIGKCSRFRERDIDEFIQSCVTASRSAE